MSEESLTIPRKRYEKWLRGVCDWRMGRWEKELNGDEGGWEAYFSILKGLDGRYKRDREGKYRRVSYL